MENNTNKEMNQNLTDTDVENLMTKIHQKNEKMKLMGILQKEIKEYQTLKAKCDSKLIKIKKINDQIEAL